MPIFVKERGRKKVVCHFSAVWIGIGVAKRSVSQQVRRMALGRVETNVRRSVEIV